MPLYLYGVVSADGPALDLPAGVGGGRPVLHRLGALGAIVSPLDRLSTFTVPATFKDVPEPTEPAPDKPDLIHVESGC